MTQFNRHIPSNELAHDGHYELKINNSATPRRKINLNKPAFRKRKRKRKHSSQHPITKFFNTYDSAREAQITNSTVPCKRPRRSPDSVPRNSFTPAPKGSDCLGANFPT